MLQIGDPAPGFTLPRDDGPPLSLADRRGSTTVLFFYPRDATPGCTTQARDFSQQRAAFEALGAQAWGISRDTLASHARFRAKQELEIPLLSDAQNAPEDGVCALYGVWKEKTLYGKTHMGIERSTFVIGPEGTITHLWRKVRVPGHVEAVRAALDAA